MVRHPADPALLRQRLLHDLAELRCDPYPGVRFHPTDEHALEKACLVLSPEGSAPLHLSVVFGERYPLAAPVVTIQSPTDHPQIFGSRICASILKTGDGWTPAYTLKGLCMQLLSFFARDEIEGLYQSTDEAERAAFRERVWESKPFGGAGRQAVDAGFRCARGGLHEVLPAGQGGKLSSQSTAPDEASTRASAPRVLGESSGRRRLRLIDLPPELLLLITNHLPDEALRNTTRATTIFAKLAAEHDLLAQRELRCFVLKQSFRDVNLGIGVRLHKPQRRYNKHRLSSEFELVSQQACEKLHVHKSILGLEFEDWLPLPISEAHWLRVKGEAERVLDCITRSAIPYTPSPTADMQADALYFFMNDIVVSLAHFSTHDKSDLMPWGWRSSVDDAEYKRSTLLQASEKAVWTYFQLYHLLIVLATEKPEIVEDANARVVRFIAGKTGKREEGGCPDLGHLMGAMLIADSAAAGSVELRKTVVDEAVVRNVYWMLDSTGARMPELSYMEPDEVSEYRLRKTYEASRASYCVLMIAHSLRRAIFDESVAQETLPERREELFARHGAPPAGVAASLATAIRSMLKIDAFPAFLREMELPVPCNAQLSQHFRDAVEQSMDKGYTRRTLTQAQALRLRLAREPGVGVRKGVVPTAEKVWNPRFCPLRIRW